MRLQDVAKVIRSKNAGPFLLTIDLLFPSAALFEAVRDSGAITLDVISARYRIPHDDIRIIFYPPGRAIKITMPRRTVSGDIADTDVYGAQQHAPLLDIEIPDPS